ncbi:hypothetical protein [Paenibacillus sp. XY044]|uniref:hypothetical protein n=1 Tax=Paenibacillus sp. XY044 TaxID=2026089 RepID=UPI000B99AB0B|nr:hypothetical protein [Paenibacillus sp. XY044]OZB98007.1 hypothetical protein CJP46_02250 [Paenibacillus sp. XY044]
MALQKPFNINIRGQTLDSADPILVSWQVSGDLSVAYQVKIYKNADNALVYDSNKITSYAQNHVVPKNSISNGLEFKIQIIIWNQSNSSITSDFDIFQTSSKPVVTMNSIDTVGSPSYSFTATYTQLESIAIRSWVMYLYDINKNKIYQSPISTNPDISLLIENLQSGNTYYIETQATSAKGLTNTTGLIQFKVQYQQPDIKVNLTAENVDNSGMKISWNTVQIIGSTTKSPIYLSGEFIDLTDDTFSFSEGFSLSGDFTIKIWMTNIKPDTDLFVIKGINGTISLQYWSQDNKFHVFKDAFGYRSHNTSLIVTGTSFFVCIQQIFSDMNIFAEVV